MTKFRSTLLGAFAAGTVVLASCSASATDFKKAAEKAINDYKGTITFTKATCETPPDHNVNTTFTCVGTGSDGNAYNFVATITSKTKVEVASAPDTSGTPTTDGTAGSTVDTTGASTVATDAPTATTTG